MPLDQPSDSDLILAIGQGDVKALEQFYDRHRVVAYSLALRILGAPADAEDAIQGVFLSVWRSAGTY
ncbi:MAG: sigma factor [Chloroflexota bacterium]